MQGTSGPQQAAAPRNAMAICREAESTLVPEEPDAATGSKAEPPCDAEALYYGIGRAPDVKAALHCAGRHVRDASPESWGPFDGESLLMTIYANGRGVPRRLDVALALACRVGGAPAEGELRIQHLSRLLAERWSGSGFSICDDATSGLLGGMCVAHDERIAAVGRTRRLDAVAARLSPAAAAAFARLRRAEAAFSGAVAENKVDQTGTARTAGMIWARAKQDDAFAALAETLGKVPARPAPASAYRDADAALNATYGTLMAKDDGGWGTVDKAGIRTTQRAWLAYRDAFLACARATGDDPDVVAASLTRDRTAWLREMPG